METNGKPIELSVSLEGYRKAKFVFDNNIRSLFDENEFARVNFKLFLERDNGSQRIVKCYSDDNKGLLELLELLKDFNEVNLRIQAKATDESLQGLKSQTENQHW